MSIQGIDRVVFGVEDPQRCRQFYLDWGLKLVREQGDAIDFESLNGCEVLVRRHDDAQLPPAIEPGSTSPTRDRVPSSPETNMAQ